MDKATRKDECVERVTRVASHRQLDIGFSWFSGGLMGGTRNLSQQQDMTSLENGKWMKLQEGDITGSI